LSVPWYSLLVWSSRYRFQTLKPRLRCSYLRYPLALKEFSCPFRNPCLGFSCTLMLIAVFEVKRNIILGCLLIPTFKPVHFLHLIRLRPCHMTLQFHFSSTTWESWYRPCLVGHWKDSIYAGWAMPLLWLQATQIDEVDNHVCHWLEDCLKELWVLQMNQSKAANCFIKGALVSHLASSDSLLSCGDSCTTRQSQNRLLTHF
jgi:hypothetical protein